MNHHYTAKIYSNNEEIAQKSGDDIDDLYIWMLTYHNGNGCGTHGEIFDNITEEVVRKFKKSPIE
ncbi:hypothetical protein [Legionella hackeliae]|uniref:Uncharacterized protein n=1 Tax=Legionella hackeliae TaxID=449 RepID=A0A0A8ULY7_LEGHA|nr:hypothetical protein [Legionella hackeliae]KTD10252.1 hypothetical protein Lhac_2620 [Legionella hackeliae]CEK09748.1 conserved protein of unknown function [Legionella hackeliae]STX49658.1 Uncharacterised protein [Legionella hackeliae]